MPVDILGEKKEGFRGRIVAFWWANSGWEQRPSALVEPSSYNPSEDDVR